MTDILKIDTAQGIVKQEKIEPLPLYGEDFSLLSVKIPEVEEFGSDFLVKLSKALKLTRKLYGAVGLSANQCGFPVRMFVIGTDDYDMVCVNPKIVETSETKTKQKEGCLSFPALVMNVERPEWVVAEYQDEFGTSNKVKLDGVTAKCFCHELDHLNGIKFTELVGKTTLHMARQKQKKVIKNYKRHS